MHRLLAIVLAVTLTGFPAVHASVAQAHDSSQHAQSGVEDPAAHHAGTQACDPAAAECEDTNTHATCCPALSGNCSGSSAALQFSQLVPRSARSPATSSVVPDAMSGLNLQPETPPPRSLILPRHRSPARPSHSVITVKPLPRRGHGARVRRNV